jgi:hypothetical protein
MYTFTLLIIHIFNKLCQSYWHLLIIDCDIKYAEMLRRSRSCAVVARDVITQSFCDTRLLRFGVSRSPEPVVNSASVIALGVPYPARLSRMIERVQSIGFSLRLDCGHRHSSGIGLLFESIVHWSWSKEKLQFAVDAHGVRVLGKPSQNVQLARLQMSRLARALSNRFPAADGTRPSKISIFATACAALPVLCGDRGATHADLGRRRILWQRLKRSVRDGLRPARWHHVNTSRPRGTAEYAGHCYPTFQLDCL